MTFLLKVILMMVAASAGLFAIVTVGFGTFGILWALSSNSGGFVGEEGFYASALFFLSLFAIAAGGAAAIISYACWVRWTRCGA